ncbi:hypothetical protein ACFLRA_02540, partial [Bdellovibrionota bacterium]
ITHLSVEAYEQVIGSFEPHQLERPIVATVTRVVPSTDGKPGSVTMRFGVVDDHGDAHSAHTETFEGDRIPVQPDAKPQIGDLTPGSMSTWGLTGNREAWEEADPEVLILAAEVGGAAGDLNEEQRREIGVEEDVPLNRIPLTPDADEDEGEKRADLTFPSDELSEVPEKDRDPAGGEMFLNIPTYDDAWGAPVT